MQFTMTVDVVIFSEYDAATSVICHNVCKRSYDINLKIIEFCEKCKTKILIV